MIDSYYAAYVAGYDDSGRNAWNIGAWPPHLQDLYTDGHWDASVDCDRCPPASPESGCVVVTRAER